MLLKIVVLKSKHTYMKQNMADSQDQQQSKAQERQVVTFTAEQISAWAKQHEEYNNPHWEASEEARRGYAKAMRHLKYYIKNPVRDFIDLS